MESTIMSENKPKSKGMQYVTQMTKQGEYYYLRIPKERNHTAKKYFESKKYLLVTFREVEVEEY